MTSKEKMELAVLALDDKKALDIRVIKVADVTVIADYFVIATGTSSTQVKALADEVDYKLSEQKIMPDRVEGYQTAQWILLDYSNVLVHVFYGQTREFYSLERLWGDGEEIDISHLIKK